MKILFIAPIPPPIDGQSKASKVLLDHLTDAGHEIDIINLSKKNLISGLLSFKRIFEVLANLLKVYKNCDGQNIIYLSLAESFFGNLRDLMIYAICKRHKKKIIIHMLGGAGMKEILSGTGLQFIANKFFIREIGGVIVEGPVNYEVFAKVINRDRIHVVPNFAEEYLFINDRELELKFQSTSTINILFLSNLITGKGHIELLEAYTNLNTDLRDRINLSFVGGFESEKLKKHFIQKLDKNQKTKYLGSFIDGEEKRQLYLNSHVFCLPTYYPFEGQPISILEAYATGCVVITTAHSGIPYIFSDGKNGFLVEKESPSSISLAIYKLFNQTEILKSIACNNRNEALSKYRITHFQNKISKVFSDISLQNNE